MPKSSSRRGLVLVTGGSGFVADYCIAQLLNDGWSVRTTVQSVAKSKAVRATIGSIGAKVRKSSSLKPISIRTRAGTKLPVVPSTPCMSPRPFR